MPWVPVAKTRLEKGLFAHNWTKRQAERRKAFIEGYVGDSTNIRFNIERRSIILDWRVLPDVWIDEDVHRGRLPSPADDDRPGSSNHGLDARSA